jgi:hypothetical protein
MHAIAQREDPHHCVGVGTADRLPIFDHTPAHRMAQIVNMGHRGQVGWHLHRNWPGDGLPVQESPLDVRDRDRSGVVVGLLSLVLGPVVPGRSAVVCVADQRVDVEGFQGLATHDVCFLPQKRREPRTTVRGSMSCAVFSCLRTTPSRRRGSAGGEALAPHPCRRRRSRGSPIGS